MAIDAITIKTVTSRLSRSELWPDVLSISPRLLPHPASAQANSRCLPRSRSLGERSQGSHRPPAMSRDDGSWAEELELASKVQDSNRSAVIGYVNGRREKQKRAKKEVQTLGEVCFGNAVHAQGQKAECVWPLH